MGSDPKVDKGADGDEQPQRKVYLDGYWMGQTPVTNAHYAAFVKATGRLALRHWSDGKIPPGQEQHPVIYVSWEDAAAFCAWASQLTGRKVRLPTEAEWEKAARGTDGRKYPWGNSDPTGSRCNFADRNTDFRWRDKNVDDGYRNTSPVGHYPAGASPYGLLDMAGNVWELSLIHISEPTRPY